MIDFTFSKDLGALFDVPDDYERDQISAFASRVKSARRFVDVGANKGLYSYIAGRIVSGAEIVLVEANPDLCETLRHNTQLLHGDKNTISIHNCGASDQNGHMNFVRGERHTLGTFTMKEGAAARERTLSIPTQRLDSILEPLPFTIFKIDVEGLEWRVLNGGISLMKQEGCCVFVELHGWGDAETGKYPFQVLLLMFRNGFGVKRVSSSYQYIFQRAPFIQRLYGFSICGPLHFLKFLARRSGFRPYFYKLRRALA